MGIRGIGGVFFKAADPERLAAWYEKHLGVTRDAEGFTVFGWREVDRPHSIGQTVWSPFPEDTEYFQPSSARWMINYRVDHLDDELERLKAEGVELVGEPEAFDYGRFAWVLDCEGNKVELWEPPFEPAFEVTVPEETQQHGVWLVEAPLEVAATGEQMRRKKIVVETRVDLPIDEVWRLWTTSDGLAEWLVEESRVDLRLGGEYELYFDLDESPGRRGGEGNKILSFLAPRMLSFTWNSPPSHEYTRSRLTHVVVEFDESDEGTGVRLTHVGWPKATHDNHPQWDDTIRFFEEAWGRVMASLEGRAR